MHFVGYLAAYQVDIEPAEYIENIRRLFLMISRCSGVS